VQSRTLYRLAGWAGLVGAALLFIAVARRGGLIPENAFTHAIAPPASALTLFTLTALYLYQRERAGALGLIGYAINLCGLAGLFAIEFATHAIFPYLSTETRDDLLDGPTRGYFLAVATLFLAGVIMFGIASLRAPNAARGGGGALPARVRAGSSARDRARGHLPGRAHGGWPRRRLAVQRSGPREAGLNSAARRSSGPARFLPSQRSPPYTRRRVHGGEVGHWCRSGAK
jgi:hypothetical protein